MTADLTIAQLAERSGVKAGTLRMWETRYGFPEPERTPSGHRRYRRSDVELVQQVASERDGGMSLSAAIERARKREEDEPDGSFFADLRRERPDLDVHLLSKKAMLALSFAMEDECRAQAVRPIIYGSFQTEHFFRQSEERWRELSRTAEAVFVFADFETPRMATSELVEVPLDPASPARREWSLIFDSDGFHACLAGWEVPRENVPDHARTFEALWSVDPAAVRHVARLATKRARKAAPEIADRVAERLEAPTAPIGPRELRNAAVLTSRMAAYLSETL